MLVRHINYKDVKGEVLKVYRNNSSDYIASVAIETNVPIAIRQLPVEYLKPCNWKSRVEFFLYLGFLGFTIRDKGVIDKARERALLAFSVVVWFAVLSLIISLI